MERKGSLKSIGAVIGVVALGFLFSSVIATILLQQMANFSIFSTGLPAEILSQGLGLLAMLDTIFISVIGVFFSLILIQSFRTKMHPIWGIVGVLGLAVLTITSGFIANIANFFVNLDVVAPAANNFQYMVQFFTNLPMITAGFGAIVIIVMIAGGRIISQRGGI